MKKINIWLVLLLNIVTLGIYGLVWLAKRRKEMQNIDSSLAIPSPVWIIVSFISIVASSGFFIWSSYVDPESSLTIIAFVALFVLLFVLGVVSIWWIYEFSKAASKITKQKINSDWSLVLFIVAEPIMMMLQQHYFNKSNSKDKSNFVLVSVIVFAISIAAIIAGSAFGLSSFTKWNNELQSTQQKVEALKNEYDDCIQKLNKDYVEVTQDNKESYSKDYDDCEDLRQEHIKAIDEYNKLREGSVE